MSSKSKSKKFVYKEGVTKKHEVLKEAMKYLSPITLDVPTKKSKQFEFVCQCINKTTNENALDFNDKSGLIKEIEERLDSETLNSWLFRKHNISYADQKDNQGRKLQYTRLCWMQSMYEEFLSKDE